MNAWNSWYAASALVRRCTCTWLGFTEGTRWNSPPPCPPANPCPMSHAVLLILQRGSNLLLHVLIWPWMLRVFTKRWRKQWLFSAVTHGGCSPGGLLIRLHVVRKMGEEQAIRTNWILNAEQASAYGTLKIHACRINILVSCICVDVGKTPNALKVNARKSGHRCAAGGGCAVCPVTHLQHFVVVEGFQ